MDILVFTHGTIVMHGEGVGVTREERVRQSRERTASVFDLASYAPVGQALPKLWRWQVQAARIAYLGPSRKPESMAKNEEILRHLGFPPGPLHHRGPDETYAQVVERIRPDVLIEDDCESIGGAAEMATPHLSAQALAHIKTIVVAEFGALTTYPTIPRCSSPGQRPMPRRKCSAMRPVVRSIMQSAKDNEEFATHDLHRFDKPDGEMTHDDWEAFAEETEQMYQRAIEAWDEYAQEHPEIMREQWMTAVLNERAEH